MNILVTGGCGFIGSHLCDALIAACHGVLVLDNLSTGKESNLPKGATLTRGDVADAALVQKLVDDADAVFHLAAVASVEACQKDWLNAHRTNLTGTVTVLDAARRAGNKPVIYASSAAVYGDNPNLPLLETAETKPINSYGLDKLSCEQYAASAWRDYQLPSAGLRFFNVFGPRQDPKSPYSGVISIFMERAKKGETLFFNGDGEQTRDFVYVGDIVQLLLAAWEAAGSAEVFNGCTGRATSLKQLAAAIGKATGKTTTTAHRESREGDIRHSLGSPLKAQNILNFTAETSLEDGLRLLVSYA